MPQISQSATITPESSINVVTSPLVLLGAMACGSSVENTSWTAPSTSALNVTNCREDNRFRKWLIYLLTANSYSAPWLTSARHTRGGVTNSKRWARLFTSLATRAIHIELVENMDSFRLYQCTTTILSLAGTSDTVPFCGTNFVEPYNKLQASLNEMDHNLI